MRSCWWTAMRSGRISWLRWTLSARSSGRCSSSSGTSTTMCLRMWANFLDRLRPFLKKLPKDHRFVVEIRNKNWLDARFADTLQEHNVALALIDQSWMPRPWEMPSKFGLITSDFTYVRWLGDRKGIEEVTKTWDKTVVDRREDLINWVEVFQQFVSRNLKVFAYANNHYAGHGPATVKLLWDLFKNRE